VTTDEVILAGYAAQSPGAFRIAGSAFSEERYGIGMKKGDSELRAKINDALVKMEQEGAWKAAFERNLGPAGIPTPAPPRQSNATDRYATGISCGNFSLAAETPARLDLWLGEALVF